MHYNPYLVYKAPLHLFRKEILLTRVFFHAPQNTDDTGKEWYLSLRQVKRTLMQKQICNTLNMVSFPDLGGSSVIQVQLYQTYSFL